MSMTLAVSMLAACGTKTEDTPNVTETAVEENSIEGKYIAVAETLADIWSYKVDSGFELKKDGEAVYTSYGMEFDATWEEQEDGNTKITYGAGDKIVEPYAEQEGAYVIKDSDTSYTIYAKEGSPTAEPMHDAWMFETQRTKPMLDTIAECMDR